ncbi:MAG: adenosylcobinamide-phosphate synthase CbiB [Clostridiales bacterium]|jgi:adenosylcobinamide-phosphate synthase|nr:adenosylcobinamide-phosphate synthase CbiB [Clostridiales bacterium]
MIFTVSALSLAALVTGFVLDIIFGDPHGFPHIVRLMGFLISKLEFFLRSILPNTKNGQRAGGIILVISMTIIFGIFPFALLWVIYDNVPILGYIIESFICYQLLAVKSLKTESLRVYKDLYNNDVSSARKSLSMIVGRDTKTLDKNSVIRAVIETVAENTSDGVFAPLLFTALGGGALGMLYKAVNTMDSMVGYKNDKYINFGRAAAKTDDAFNFIPSRLCAKSMILGAYLIGLDYKNAAYIWHRDRFNHKSPNSAQTEAVCAGALNLRLAGPAVYFGKVIDKPYIGDCNKKVDKEDIKISHKLMYCTAFIGFVLAVLFRLVCMEVCNGTF